MDEAIRGRRPVAEPSVAALLAAVENALDLADRAGEPMVGIHLSAALDVLDPSRSAWMVTAEGVLLPPPAAPLAASAER